MLLDLTVSATIAIHAGPEQVWHALTTPAIIAQYLHGTETLTDWQVGSDIIFQGEFEGQQYRDKGKILEHIPLQKIVYSYWSGFSGVEDLPENYSTVTYDVVKRNDTETELTWTVSGYATEAGYQHSADGMGDFVEKIKHIIEQGA
jgi:uncharacterized protein YndB with AHSA1/START domain